MMRTPQRLIYWLLAATRGGPTRLRILKILSKNPRNIHQLSKDTNLDYKTVQGHIKILLQHGILDVEGERYGAMYLISSEWLDNVHLNDFLQR